MNSKNIIWIIVLIIISLGGYVLAFIQFKNNKSMEELMLNSDLDEIGVIDDNLLKMRKERKITLKDLERSRYNIQKLIEATKNKDTTSLNLDDAMKIINELK